MISFLIVVFLWKKVFQYFIYPLFFWNIRDKTHPIILNSFCNSNTYKYQFGIQWNFYYLLKRVKAIWYIRTAQFFVDDYLTLSHVKPMFPCNTLYKHQKAWGNKNAWNGLITFVDMWQVWNNNSYIFYSCYKHLFSPSSL